ncbi:MAG TPA: AraC family transcriptional regulator [Aridibacter sp.]|nr:AraC family transcriptional regulator [Aridibacter sp.]
MTIKDNDDRLRVANAVKKLNSYRSTEYSIEVSDYPPGYFQGWHRHESFIVTMLLKGYVREQTRSGEMLIRPLSSGLRIPGTLHKDVFSPAGVRAIRIAVAPSFVARLEDESLVDLSSAMIFDREAVSALLGLSMYLAQTEKVTSIVSEKLFELFGLLGDRRSSAESDAPRWLLRSKEYLEDTFAEGTQLAHLADLSGVHPVYFARQFRRFYGCSVGEYRRKLQFQEAVDLLGDRRLSIAETACSVGFSDQSHFSRIFVRELGITPGRYRRFLT